MANSLNCFFKQVKNQSRFTRKFAKFGTLLLLALIVCLVIQEPASAGALEKLERAIAVWLAKSGSGVELHEIQTQFDGYRLMQAVVFLVIFLGGAVAGLVQGNWVAPLACSLLVIAIYLTADGLVSTFVPDYLTSKASYCKLVDVTNSRFCREEYLVWWNPLSWGDKSQQRYDNPIWTGPRSPGQQNSLPDNLNQTIQDILGGRR